MSDLTHQVLGQLKKVNFSKNGYDVSFDVNGDPVATYELVNWQKSESGSIEMVTVGLYDASLPNGQQFSINRNFIWVDGGTHVRSPTTINIHHKKGKIDKSMSEKQFVPSLNVMEHKSV